MVANKTLEKMIFDELMARGESLLGPESVDAKVARSIAQEVASSYKVEVVAVIEGGCFLGASATEHGVTVEIIDWDNIDGGDEHFVLGMTEEAWQAEHPDEDFREAADKAMTERYPVPVA